VRASIVGRDHLDVLVVPASVRLLVLDSKIREMELVVEVRQIVFVRPVANLVRRPIRVAVVIPVVLVAFVQPPLIVALELVIEDHLLDVGVPLEETRFCLFVGAVDLEVVFQFPLTRQARVERLVGLLIAIAVMLEEAAAFLRQDHRLVPIARQPDGLDQAGLAEVPEVAGTGISGTIVVVTEVTTGDHSKGTHGSQGARLRAAQGVLAIAVANKFSLESARKVQVPGEDVPELSIALPTIPVAAIPTRILVAIAASLLRRVALVAWAATKRSNVVVRAGATAVVGVPFVVAGIVIARIEIHGRTTLPM